MHANALDKAIEIFGTQERFAEEIGIRSPSVSGWRKAGRVPIERCPAIERVTKGKVTRHDLRPDFFGNAPRVRRAG